MTLKEKAKELVDRCGGEIAALIAVDEILSMGIMSHSGDW
jgi:hypothetical protein